jgi:hypothetical protein
MDWTNWNGESLKILDALEIATKMRNVKVECKTNGVIFDSDGWSIMLVWADIAAMNAAELAKLLIEGSDK